MFALCVDCGSVAVCLCVPCADVWMYVCVLQPGDGGAEGGAPTPAGRQPRPSLCGYDPYDPYRPVRLKRHKSPPTHHHNTKSRSLFNLEWKILKVRFSYLHVLGPVCQCSFLQHVEHATQVLYGLSELCLGAHNTVGRNSAGYPTLTNREDAKVVSEQSQQCLFSERLYVINQFNMYSHGQK